MGNSPRVLPSGKPGAVHLAKYRSWMQGDGYAGFEDLYRSGDIREVACMAHVRRKFACMHKAQGSAIANEAIRRIAELYAVEKAVRGLPPDKRAEIRQAEARPVFVSLEAWLYAQLPNISGKSPLATAIRHALTRRTRIRPYLDHGILELDNNTAERAMRAIASGRKNNLFVGPQTGGKSVAVAYTLIETAKLNSIDPQARLAHTLAHIADHKINLNLPRYVDTYEEETGGSVDLNRFPCVSQVVFRLCYAATETGVSALK